MNREQTATNVKVGIFLAIGLVTLGVGVFLVGQKSGLFEGKSELYAHFADINGLVEGAPVRLAGLDVGTVSEIRFPEDLRQKGARVTLSIKSRYMSRIRTDSVAFIDSKGLLGDKLINITLGTPKGKEMPEEGTLTTKTAPSIEHLATTVEEAVASVTEVSKSAQTAIQQFSSEQIRKDLERITTSTANILGAVEHGEGFAHDLFYDPEVGKDMHGVLTDTRAALADLRGAIERVDRTVAAIEHGNGMAHELLFGESGKRTMANLEQSSADMAALVRDARESKGLLHALVYDPENAQAVTDLKQAFGRVNHIVGEIEKGRGTLGGLAVDPSVYEDLKTVLGNIERNVVLKALIRYTIKEGDIRRPANETVRHAPAE